MSNEGTVILPTTKVAAVSKSPNNLIIFSKPKVGKTSLLAGLDDCLILDLQKGTDFVDALKINASSVDEIKNIGKAIKEAGNPYKYVAVDTMTDLEELCIPYAEQIYSKTSMGQNWFNPDPAKGGKLKYGTIVNMPEGNGYMWLREAFTRVTEYIKTWAPRTIFSCHIKDILLDKQGTSFNSMDIDLTGKIKRIVTSQSDAIGYLYRKGNQNILSFKTNDEVTCGARPEHLRNQEIVLSELSKDGTLSTHWDRVYID